MQNVKLKGINLPNRLFQNDIFIDLFSVNLTILLGFFKTAFNLRSWQNVKEKVLRGICRSMHKLFKL